MTSFVTEYNGYTIDSTPSQDGEKYRPHYTITNNDPRAKGDPAHQSGDLIERGTQQEMSDYALAEAKKWVDEK